MSTMMDQPTFDLVKGNSVEEEEVGADEFWPLSGEPFFSVFVMKSNLAPLYQMIIPVKFHQSLPPASFTMVINYRGKKWELTCRSSGQKRRRYANWKNFVIDNDLKVGDACVFERSNYSERLIEFKVQILKGGNPLELVEEDDGTIDTPIVIH